MTDIDLSNTHFTAHVGDRCKRSLIRHFTALLVREVAQRGLTTDRIADRDALEGEAWRLAEKVIDIAEAEASDLIQLGGHLDITGAPELLGEILPRVIAETEKEYLEDDLFGADFLIDRATMAPLVVP